jgi:hypothetical protein
LAAIAAGCPGMRRFSLRQAHKVTQAGVQVKHLSLFSS